MEDCLKQGCLKLYTNQQKKLCVTKIFNSFLHTFKSIYVYFRKWSRSLHILCDFKFTTTIIMKYHYQIAFVLRGIPFTLKQEKSIYFSRLAPSVTCTSTLRKHSYLTFWFAGNGLAPTTNDILTLMQLSPVVLWTKIQLAMSKLKIHGAKPLSEPKLEYC